MKGLPWRPPYQDLGKLGHEGIRLLAALVDGAADTWSKRPL